MLDGVMECLACPHCGGSLESTGPTLRCPSGHSFDIARRGYVNLLPGDAVTGTADTPSMVAARAAFLERGHYAPLARALAGAASRQVPAGQGCVVDAGAGTGYYLAAVLDRLPGRSGLALDISKHAAARAARAHARIGAAVTDTWRQLPVRDEAADLVLDVFAPRNAAEFARILRPKGVLLVVTPTERHLGELVGMLGLLTVDERKQERLSLAFADGFSLVEANDLEWTLALSPADVRSAVQMGPSARHVAASVLEEKTRGLETPVTATASVTVTEYRRG